MNLDREGKNGNVLRKEDYEALAWFRYMLRRFLHFTEEGARSVGLTPQQHQILLAVKGQPGRDWATVTELAEWLQLRHHTIVGLLDRCAASGLVCRTHDPDDRRLVRVLLTEKGEALLARLSERNLAELHALHAALNTPVLAQTMQTLAAQNAETEADQRESDQV